MIAIVRALVILVLAVGAVQVHRVRSRLAAREASPVAVARLSDGLRSIPLVLDAGRYVGKEHPLTRRIVDAAGADVFLSTQYQDERGGAFQLYVGASLANEENLHSPSFCMPAAGWEVVEEGSKPFTAYPVADGDPKMRRLTLQHGEGRMVVYYWFQAGERVADHEFSVRYARLWDLLAGHPLRPTIIVVVYAPVFSNLEATESGAQAFMSAIGPHLKQALAR